MASTEKETDAPWRDKETLRRLHWDEGLNQEEIASELGCTRRTITKWFGRLGLEARQGRPRKPWVYFETDQSGYERWQDHCRASRSKLVRVHRLAAVAWFGWDAIQDKHVHHKNRVPWDNREENLELLTSSEHSRYHAKEGHSIDNQTGLIAQYGEEAVLGTQGD